MKLELDKYLEHTESWGQIVFDPKGFEQFKYLTPITPKEYLAFADKDLLIAGNHGLVNSLSNSKRAIDCQITNILSILGLPTTGNIHLKTQRLESIGILAPRIIKKINKIRNLLEHEFHEPTIEEAEDAVDIATLFVEATDKVFREYMGSWWVAEESSANNAHIVHEENKTIIYNENFPQSTYSEGIYTEYDQENHNYYLSFYSNNEEVFDIAVKVGSELHLELLKFSIFNFQSVVNFDEDTLALKFLRALKEKVGASL